MLTCKGSKKHYNLQHTSTYSNPRRPTTMQEELALKCRMRQKYTKQQKNKENLTNANKTAEAKNCGRSVLATYHKTNQIQRPGENSHAR